MSHAAVVDERAVGHLLRIHQHFARERKVLAALARERSIREGQEHAVVFRALEPHPVARAAGDPLRLVIPSGPRRTRALPAWRRARYREHLRGIISEAMSSVEAPEASTRAARRTTSDAPVNGRLCAMCGGGCCTRGGETAYLTPATIRRFVASRPWLSEQDVLNAYLSALGSKTVSKSCVNHTADGCGLARAMRSDTCNTYACESLTRLDERGRTDSSALVALVVRRRQDHWNATCASLPNDITGLAVLTESRTARVRTASKTIEANPEERPG